MLWLYVRSPFYTLNANRRSCVSVRLDGFSPIPPTVWWQRPRLASLLGDCAHGLPRTTPVCRAQSLVWITLPLASCFVHRLSPVGVWKRANMRCFCVQGCVGRARRRQRAQRLTSLDHLRRRRTCHMCAFACSRAGGCWPGGSIILWMGTRTPLLTRGAPSTRRVPPIFLSPAPEPWQQL